MAHKPAVVIDNGSGFLKAGVAGGKQPSVIFPAVVGRKKPRCRRSSLLDVYAGEEAVIQRSNVDLRHPLERGVVNQWTEMELVWEHAYERLKADPQQQPVLVTESVLNPKLNRRRTVETFLETFRVPSVFVADTPSLCLYADGGTTGLVLEAGYSATYAVPIVKGEVMHNAVTKLDLGGNDLTVFLLRLVESRGYFFPPVKREMFSEIKEKLCYVAMDFAKEEEEVKASAAGAQSSRIKKSYNLAGDVVTLQTERFQCPESLFQPNWLRVDALGVHQLIHDSIEKCSPEVHDALYENILVAGGSTCFHGFLERLDAELGKVCPGGTYFDIHSPENPQTLAWRGGSEFCLTEHAKSKWITLAEYHEIGEDVIEKKRGVFNMDEEGEDNRENRDISHNWSRTHTNATPAGRDRRPLRSTGHTPGGALQQHSPRNSKMSTSRGAPSATPGAGSQHTSSMSNYSATPGLSSHKVVDKVRPKSPGVYDNKHFYPTLPKTPELTDDSGSKNLVADQQHKSGKRKDGVKQIRQTQSERPAARRPSATDFVSFRKMSLFDHLMDEVATLSPRDDDDKLKDGGGDQGVSGALKNRSLFDKMKEDQLLPGRGLSGLRRNETINFDSFKRSAGSERSAVRRTESAPEGSNTGQSLVPPVPLIEITSCPTPHGSASHRGTGREEAPPLDDAPKKIIFKFPE